MKDLYQILGISRQASEDEIKKAYYKLAQKYHPDKGGDGKKFKEISEAYQILSNKEKREQFDKYGQIFDGGMPGQEQGFDPQWFWGKQNVNFEDMFSAEFGGLGDILGEMFGFGTRSRKKNFKKGRDLEVDLEISLEDILKGKEKEIFLSKLITCQRCQGLGAEPGSKVNECFSCRGTGYVQQIKKTPFGSFTNSAVCPECKGEGFRPDKLCNVCQGEGRVNGEEKIKIFIPAGVDNNQIIKVEGRGEAGRKGGKPGDLYVRIFIKPHSLFKRKGDDLHTQTSLSFSQAALGVEIEILTLEGKKILVKVPSGTESGKVLRISEKGIPYFEGYGRGNLYIQLVVKTPKKLTKKQKELFEKLKEEGV